MFETNPTKWYSQSGLPYPEWRRSPVEEVGTPSSPVSRVGRTPVFLKLMGSFWMAASMLAASGVWLAVSEERRLVSEAASYVSGVVRPTWLSGSGVFVGLALLMQGLVIGGWAVVIARRAERKG